MKSKQDATMPQRAYSYRRVSDPYSKDGIDRQEDYATALAVKHGWCLDDTLLFTDRGRSGFHGHNRKPTAALTQFLDLVKRGRIAPGSVLIIENIDRLSRQEVDIAYDLFRDILKAGVWIATQTPERIYRPGVSSFMDLMEPIWLMYLAHAESLKKSERTKHAWITARRKAREQKTPHGNLPPCWLRKLPTGYHFIPERVAAVRRAVQLLTEGYGFRRACQQLEVEGIEAPTMELVNRPKKVKSPQPPRQVRGKWDRKFLADLVQTRVLLGEFAPWASRRSPDITQHS